MVLDRHISAISDARVYFDVTATDVSQPALSVGRSGLYPRTKFNEIPPDYRDAYVDEIDADSFQIREALRKRVGFAQFNLLDVARAPPGGLI